MYNARSFTKPGRWDKPDNRNRFNTRYQQNANSYEYRGYGDAEDDPARNSQQSGRLQKL